MTLRSRKLAFMLTAVGLVFCCVEAALRVTTSEVGHATIPDDEVRRHVEQGEMSYDPVLGWVRANYPSPAEGVDEHGFRYVQKLTVEKPGNTWRAFSIGDSQTYGAGVDVKSSYSYVAEWKLRYETPSVKPAVQIINAALSGYGSLQALRLIQSKLMSWDPDVLIIDCRTFDSPRDDLLPPRDTFPLVERMLFSWRTYYVLRLMVEEARLGGARSMRTRSLDATPEELRGEYGNHDLILNYVREQGREVLFANYPFWDNKTDTIICLAPTEELPAGAPIAHICEALQRDGRPPSELFLDNNHLSVAGNQVVGEALAAAIAEQFFSE